MLGEHGVLSHHLPLPHPGAINRQYTWRDHSQKHSYQTQSWHDYDRDPPRPAARLSAAPYSKSKPLTAFSSSQKKPSKPSKQRPRYEQEHHSWSASAIPPGHIQVTLKDDTRREWIKKARFGLNHKHRMKAASELTDAEKPQPCLNVDHDQFQTAYNAIRSLDRAIPAEVAEMATHPISGSRLLDDHDLSKAYLMDLRVTNMMALVFSLPAISRFSMPAIYHLGPDTWNPT